MFVNIMVQVFFILLAILGILTVVWLGVLVIHEIMSAWLNFKSKFFK